MTIEITSFSRVDHIVGKRGTTRLVALFDVKLTEVHLVGCALVVYKNGKRSVWTPRFPHMKARMAVHLLSDQIARDITDEALRAFYAIGGRDEHLTPVENSASESP